MPDSHSITDTALRYLGPRRPQSTDHFFGQEYVIGSPLHDAIIADNRMLSLAQLAEATEALCTHGGATLDPEIDIRRAVRFQVPGTYLMIDDNMSVFFIKSHDIHGWQAQFNDELWYTPEAIAKLAA